MHWNTWLLTEARGCWKSAASCCWGFPAGTAHIELVNWMKEKPRDGRPAIGRTPNSKWVCLKVDTILTVQKIVIQWPLSINKNLEKKKTEHTCLPPLQLHPTPIFQVLATSYMTMPLSTREGPCDWMMHWNNWLLTEGFPAGMAHTELVNQRNSPTSVSGAVPWEK